MISDLPLGHAEAIRISLRRLAFERGATWSSVRREGIDSVLIGGPTEGGQSEHALGQANCRPWLTTCPGLAGLGSHPFAIHVVIGPAEVWLSTRSTPVLIRASKKNWETPVFAPYLPTPSAKVRAALRSAAKIFARLAPDGHHPLGRFPGESAHAQIQRETLLALLPHTTQAALESFQHRTSPFYALYAGILDRICLLYAVPKPSQTITSCNGLHLAMASRTD